MRVVNTAAELNGLTADNLDLWRCNGTTWDNKGGTLDTTNLHITCVWASDTTALRRWTLATGNPSGPPTGMTVTRFVAKPDAGGVTLE